MCVEVVHHQGDHRCASLYGTSAKTLMKRARSFFVFFPFTPTYLLPFNGSLAINILQAPLRPYPKSTFFSFPGAIAIGILTLISCLGDSSMQATGRSLS